MIQICFAIYGPPAEDADTLEKAYTAEQRKFGTTIYEKILEVYKKAPEPKFKLGFLFIFCKEGKSTYQVRVKTITIEFSHVIIVTNWVRSKDII